MLPDRTDIGYRFLRFWFFVTVFKTAKRFEIDGKVDFEDPIFLTAVMASGRRVYDAAAARGFVLPESGWQ